MGMGGKWESGAPQIFKGDEGEERGEEMKTNAREGGDAILG